MSLTPSTMLPLGTLAPAFSLEDASTGQQVALKTGRPTLVMFICNHCPYVKHVAAELAALGSEYMERGVGVYAISSNDISAYPQDAPAKMRETAREQSYTFPYLFDESQNVAKAYQAACTPDFYVFDKEMRCVYRGQLDDSRPGNSIPVTGRDLRAALDALLAGRAISAEQKPSVGCNIKWR